MSRRPRRLAALAATLVSAALATGCGLTGHEVAARPVPARHVGTPTTTTPTTPAGPGTGKPTPVPHDDPRPNILLITTDDETMSDMRWMPRTRHLLGAAGITFPNMLSPHPLCCPARAEILTGQYAQNNGVRSNTAALLGGFHRLDGQHTIATELSKAGYQTAFVGKYLNEYHGEDGVQPGWDIWNPTITNVYGYYGYTMFNEGHYKHYKNLHNADLVGMKAAQYIKRMSQGDKPFFIWASHVAPHGSCPPHQELSCWQPPIPAKRHAHLFAHAQSPSLTDPAFNEGDVSDKPLYIRNQQLVDPAEVNYEFRQRIRSLQAVDEAVARDIKALRKTGELDNTIVAFTSDNGYLLGEHRYMFKNVPYEQALRVPLLVRGPGIAAGQERSQTVSMVDLAPTFLDAANAKASLPVDGRSILPLIKDPTLPGYETVLIQSGPRNAREVAAGWAYRGVRTDRYTYVHYPTSGFTELYDRLVDPAELTNVATDPRYAAVAAELDRRSLQLEPCKAAGCRARFGPVPDPS